jgi:molybdopterin-binding protein
MSLLTVRAAADRLGVGYSTLKQWIYDGSVRTSRTRGGHHRMSPAEVERLLANQGIPTDYRRRPRSPAGPPAIVALSPRNQLRGVIEEVRLDGLLAQVRLRVGEDTVTAVITRDAATSLGLKRGGSAIALIKSTEVMIATEPEPTRKHAAPVRPRTNRRRV